MKCRVLIIFLSGFLLNSLFVQADQSFSLRHRRQLGYPEASENGPVIPNPDNEPTNPNEHNEPSTNSSIPIDPPFIEEEEEEDLIHKDPTATISTKKAIVASQAASNVASKIVSAFTVGSSMGLSASLASKIFSNIKFLNITYSSDLQIALATWKSSFFAFDTKLDPFHIQENASERPMPEVFEKYETPSSFLLNFLETLWVLVTLSLVLFLSRFFEWAVGKTKNLNTLVKVSRGFRVLTQNFLLTQLYNIYGDLVLFAILEYRSIDFRGGVAQVSFALSAFLIVVMTIGFALHIRLLVKYQRIKRENEQEDPEILEDFVHSHQGNQVLLDDFKDTSLLHQSFLIFLTLRDICFAIILTTLFKYPLLQSSLILLLNLSMIFYLVAKVPFKRFFGLAQMLFYEFIFLTVNINVIILAILDQHGKPDLDIRNQLGNSIIILNLIFNIVSFLMLIAALIFTIKDFYEAYQLKQKEKTIKEELPQAIPGNLSGLDFSTPSQNQTSSSLLILNHLIKSKVQRQKHETQGSQPSENKAKGLISSKIGVPRPIHGLSFSDEMTKPSMQAENRITIRGFDALPNKRRRIMPMNEKMNQVNHPHESFISTNRGNYSSMQLIHSDFQASNVSFDITPKAIDNSTFTERLA